jgi:hypothetical protein
LLAGELATITVVVGFTTASSPWRLAVLPALGAAVLASIPTCAHRLPTHAVANFVAGQQAMLLLQYIEVALLSR